MSAHIVDGRAVAAAVKERVQQGVAARLAADLPAPGLATVLIGDDPASHTYVGAKRKSCEALGLRSIHHELPASTSQSEVVALVEQLSEDKQVHGILVQLPLPDQIDEEAVLSAMAPAKDVDGFHPHNLGRLAQKGRPPAFVPNTPAGILELLRAAGVELAGATAVVLGRSNIVGMPMALLLVHENATVTICHSATRDLPAVARGADVLIAAVGRPEMVQGEWVKPGAAVIDVGVNRVPDDTRARGYRLVGDVAFESVKQVAGVLTPVPGGVGPMTIAMLMQNTLLAAERVDGRA